MNFATLQGLTIPEGVVTKIECGGVVLWELNLSSPASYFETDGNGTIYGLTDEGNAATELIIPSIINGETITRIENGENGFIDRWGVFMNSNATSVIFPDTLTFIGTSAFCNNTNLTTVTIPDSVVDMNGDVFYNCINLQTVHLGNGLSSIIMNTFYGCSSLTTITIPNSVIIIEYGAFRYCSGLATIIIPNSVSRFGNYAFSGCTNLQTVYYTGTEEEWGKIDKGAGNTPLTNANIVFNYAA